MNIHPSTAQLLHQVKQDEFEATSKQARLIRFGRSESRNARLRRFLSDIRK